MPQVKLQSNRKPLKELFKLCDDDPTEKKIALRIFSRLFPLRPFVRVRGLWAMGYTWSVSIARASKAMNPIFGSDTATSPLRYRLCMPPAR